MKARRGPNHPEYATALSGLARLLTASNRVAEAESLYRRALSIDEKGLGLVHPDVARDLNNLAQLLHVTNRLAEAESLHRRALVILENALGPKHPSVATAVSNLAMLLRDTNRLDEAEPLMRRALVIDQNNLGPDHPNVATRLNNLAALLSDTNRLDEAEPLMRRALSIDEKGLGLEHPDVGRDLNNLTVLLHVTNRLSEAEPLIRRALGIVEKNLGPNHPDVAVRLNNLGRLLHETNRLNEAEQLMRRAITIFEKSLGQDHPNVAAAFGSLALLKAESGDWAEVAAIGRRVKPILIRRKVEQGDSRTGIAKAALAGNAWALRAYARAEHRAYPESAGAREEGFELAQWALQTDAADALAQMSVRFANGAGPLARLVREQQDLTARRRDEMRHLDIAAGRADVNAAEKARLAVASLDQQLDGIDARLATEFKEYAELANPRPLAFAAVQAFLTDEEALVLFLDVPRLRNLPGETLIWVVTKAVVTWASIELASAALAEQAAAPRCGLDRAVWEGQGTNRCLKLLAGEKTLDGNKPLPFDLTRAHQLYQALFGQMGDLIKGKQLLIVPSGPLTQIPLGVLVTQKPDPAASGTDALRRAAWFAKSNSITVLPSVSSLKALREHARTSNGSKPFVGFGNPLLKGPNATFKVQAELARTKQKCPKSPGERIPGQAASGTKVMQQRDGLADVATIVAQVPLPETADELCAVGRDLGVPDSDIWLGARATEREVKRLSESGELAAYRIVHFATHGALAGELKAGVEPGLILTPPDEATPEDDGYLSASEIASLKLDADWVILSACNTAAGGAEGAEALSGMSRAFFYAGTRALLVSHWAVDSDAAVKLITKTLGAMAANQSIGRSEALRRSMVALIEQGEPREAHPANWAPFVLVGEGSAVDPPTKRLATSSIIPEPQPPAKVAPSASRPRHKRVTPPNWRTQIWGQ